MIAVIPELAIAIIRGVKKPELSLGKDNGWIVKIVGAPLMRFRTSQYGMDFRPGTGDWIVADDTADFRMCRPSPMSRLLVPPRKETIPAVFEGYRCSTEDIPIRVPDNRFGRNR